MGHARRGNDEVELEVGVFLQGVGAGTLAKESAEGCLALAGGVDGADFLINFKKAGTTGQTVGFEGRADGEADSFVSAAGVGDYEMSVEGVETTFDALDGSVEAFEIDAGIESV